MFVDWHLSDMQEANPGGKVYYFDLGASTFNSGMGGASQSWFVEKLEQRGLTIDGIWGWEAAGVDPNAVYDSLPGKYWPIYHWFNIKASAEVGTHYNPLTLLQRIATPEDIVIFKLDIDVQPLENAFIAQILNNPNITKLIDVLFYEQHINVHEMQGVWGSMGYTDSLADLFRTFTAIRKKGIHVHSWV